MMLKLFGALLIVTGCGGFGFLTAVCWKREELALRQLAGDLEFMACELQYRMTPLPELCGQTAGKRNSITSEFWKLMEAELEQQMEPDVSCCVQSVLNRCRKLPEHTQKALKMLGQTLGRFDLEGQLQGLNSVKNHCYGELESMAQERDFRLRSYQTLGICTGIALAIILV